MPLTLQTNCLPEADAKGAVECTPAVIPKAGSFDVVIVGGGTGGAPAAIVAGQEGLSVAVIEPQSFLGGIGTGGGIHVYYYGDQTGIQIDIDKRTSQWSKRIGGKSKGFHPEAKKLALQELADEAGVRCFFRTFFVGAAMDGNAIAGVVVENESAVFWLEAKVVIDCTGDADVAAAAGAKFAFGREGDRAPQPYSLTPGHIQGPDVVASRNFDAGYVDPTNALDQSRAQLEGRSHLRCEKLDETNRMLYVAPVMGLRESRFIDAEYVVTLADQQEQRRFPDCISTARAHYDNHARDIENESLDARMWVAVTSNWATELSHEAPYRCMVPKIVENLLVACRAVGMTHDAHNLFRMQRDIQALGEAAGVAAGVAIRSGRSVRRVDVPAIQKRLVERHALPETMLAELHVVEHHAALKATADGFGIEGAPENGGKLENSKLDELFKTCGSNREPAAFRELLRRGTSIHDELRKMLNSEAFSVRWMAAATLALQDCADGAGVLKETLAARIEEKCDTRHTSPRWESALYLLDKLGLRETGSTGLVLELLEDKAMTLHKATAAVRALGRHANRDEALEPIRRVLRRQDFECKLTIADSGNGKPAVVSDRRFTLELAATQALAKFGATDEALDLAGKHTHDPRALVRNHARKVLEEIRPT